MFDDSLAISRGITCDKRVNDGVVGIHGVANVSRLREARRGDGGGVDPPKCHTELLHHVVACHRKQVGVERFVAWGEALPRRDAFTHVLDVLTELRLRRTAVGRDQLICE